MSKTEDTRPIAAGTAHSPDTARKALTGKRYVFTSAQNNTYIHEDFFASLLNFCAENQAELVVSRFTYNKSGFQNNTKDRDGLWYDKRLQPYFKDESLQVAKDLVFCGELDILPTAVNPLSGFDGYCQGSSGIVPHAKVALNSLPRMPGEQPRFLYTTGAVTLRNYIQRKAGQKAEFHHVFGALYVEIDENGQWWARQLIADKNGVFYDLTTEYRPDGIRRGVHVLAVNYGDIHIEKMDIDVYKATWASEKCLAQVLRPQYQFVHDLTDFTARNHHNINDPYFLAERHFQEESSVEKNIELSAQFLNMLDAYTAGRFDARVIVVESNHDLAFHRWLKEADIRKDPENAEYYHEMNAEIYRNIRLRNKRFSIYEYAIRQKASLPNVEFLREDDSFVIAKHRGGIECGLHGHRGPNGARGTYRNLKGIGRRVNLGHSHSAAICEGAYVAGVSGKLDMDYNKGPSSWSHSHIVTYANGKRAIITIKDGKWRA